uniref:double-strand-break repair protein rad21 homolog n=1 Tax=Styela clava TaxID=7725 RepID=UPI0019394720|nr:double-strand-break repair protein rad21 homolog [Styela clava]
MFYAHFVLSKRGPLARIWLAAHWDKKLTKAHVFETNLEASVETIISPQVKMALRTSGHLLLGVVRIYNRKAKYLLADCNEAFVKIKMAFRPGVVDLPEDSREAPHNQIYLVEEFQDFDAPLPDISDININRNLTLNQSRLEEITMPEDVPTSFQMDEGFGGGMMGFGKEVDQFSTGDLQNMFYKDDNRKLPGSSKDLGFGMDGGGMTADMGGGGMLDDNFMQGPGLFGEGESFLGESRQDKQDEIAMETGEAAMDHQVMSPMPQQQQEQQMQQNDQLLHQDIPPQEQLETVDAQQLHIHEQPDIQTPQQGQPETTEQPQLQTTADETINVTINRNETTLIANEEEAFALEPLDITGVKDTRIRRKRKLVVDQIMELDGQTMREQLKDFTDIVTSLDMAPPTKRLMQWKELGGVDKLFANASRIFNDYVGKAYSINLHCEVPEDLKDVSATQLHELYGQDENEPADESSIQAARDISVQQHEQPHAILDQSTSLLQQPHKSLDPVIPAPNADVSLPQPAAYNSDDDYEPYSVGPPSIASSPGDNLGQPGSPPAVPEPGGISGLGDLGLSDISGIPEQAEEPQPEIPEPDEGEAYDDDVDDLRWNKRTQHLMHTLNRSFKHSNQISFFQTTEGLTRKQAVSKFYSLLVLAKQEATLLQQSESFSDVFIKQGPRFETVLM